MQPFIAAMLKVRQAFFTAIIRSLLRTKHLLQTILNIWIAPSTIKGENVEEGVSNYGTAKVALRHFLEVVERSFRDCVGEKRLVALSDGIKSQMVRSMLDNPLCMLPSYNHQLPSGEEQGTFLALDVGGSTFRVALVELAGGKNGRQECRILTKGSSKIDNPIRQLKGRMFFDWMAGKIEETLSGHRRSHDQSQPPLSMGMAWSFPIE
jgi:hexokinase